MWLLFIFSLFTAVLGSSITNGTCYYKAGEEADEIYSPCGNTIDGTWPCCQLGDKCNDHNTCTWDNGHDPIYTYVAGCTDPTYEDDHCPFKGDFDNYQWVGLSWEGCDVFNGTVNWDGCTNDGYPRVRVSRESESCVCNDTEQPLIQAPTGLVAMGYLPSSKMGEISWEAGWERTDPVVPSASTATGSSVSTRTLVPPTSLASTTTSSSSNTGSPTAQDSSRSISATQTTTTPNAGATASSINESDSASSLSTGAKVGIGLGVSLAGLIAILLCVGYVIKNRKKHGGADREFINEDDPQDQEKNSPTPVSEPAMLDAESTQRNSTWSGQKSELPGSPPNPSIMNTVSPISTGPMQNGENAVVYKPFRYQSAEMEGTTDLPVEERPSWASIDYAAYRVEQARNESYGRANHGGRDNQGDRGGAHELPG